MRSIIINLIFIFVATISFSYASEQLHLCRKFAGWGEDAMVARQSNDSYQKAYTYIMKQAPKQVEEMTELTIEYRKTLLLMSEKIIITILDQAYDEPVHKSVKNQENAIVEFSNVIFRNCIVVK